MRLKLISFFGKRLIKPIAILVFFSSVFSCRSSLIKIFIKNPVVESNNSIVEFIKKNKGELMNNYVLKKEGISEEKKMFDTFFTGVESRTLIFDKDSVLLNSSHKKEYCEAKVLSEFLSDKRSLEKQTDKKLDSYIKYTTPITYSDFVKPDYFVILYWSKSTGKRGFKDLQFLENRVKNSSKKIKIFKINTDFNKDWGLIENKVIKYKLQDDKMVFDDLPYIENID